MVSPTTLPDRKITEEVMAANRPRLMGIVAELQREIEKKGLSK